MQLDFDMRRFYFIWAIVIVLGLAVVYGETESVRVGYEIRKMNIRKLELTHQKKTLEYRVANLSVPDVLEGRMREYAIELANPKQIMLARSVAPKNHNESNAVMRLASRVMGTAQAESIHP